MRSQSTERTKAGVLKFDNNLILITLRAKQPMLRLNDFVAAPQSDHVLLCQSPH